MVGVQQAITAAIAANRPVRVVFTTPPSQQAPLRPTVRWSYKTDDLSWHPYSSEARRARTHTSTDARAHMRAPTAACKHDPGQAMKCRLARLLSNCCYCSITILPGKGPGR